MWKGKVIIAISTYILEWISSLKASLMPSLYVLFHLILSGPTQHKVALLSSLCLPHFEGASLPVLSSALFWGLEWR